VALAGVIVLATTACTPPDETTAPTGCAASVRTASQAIEPDDQVALLDAALVACASAASFRTEVGRYPGIIGYSVDDFLQRRCEASDDTRVPRSASCSGLVAAPTTPPPATIADLVFVGDTVDGRRIEIRPSNLIEFDGDIPAAVQQTVDIAVESGCDGVIAQRDLWLSRIGDPAIGDAASVFAQHAQNVAVYIQCDPPPIDLAALGLG
jgi:hypothetical protein